MSPSNQQIPLIKNQTLTWQILLATLSSFSLLMTIMIIRPFKKTELSI